MPLSYIALGANLGDPQLTFRRAIKLLGRRAGTVKAVSSFYKTAPLNAPGSLSSQPVYLNAVIALETKLTALKLFELISELEVELGLSRASKEIWGPRIIDIDLLSYADLVYSSELLILPHARLHTRDFVLLPLVEVAPRWRHPVLNRSAAQLLNQLLRSESELFMKERVEVRSTLEAELINLDSANDMLPQPELSAEYGSKNSFARDLPPR